MAEMVENGGSRDEDTFVEFDFFMDGVYIIPITIERMENEDHRPFFSTLRGVQYPDDAFGRGAERGSDERVSGFIGIVVESFQSIFRHEQNDGIHAPSR